MPIIRSSRQYVCYYRLWCAMPWLLVVGGQVQSSRLCVRDVAVVSSGQGSSVAIVSDCGLDGPEIESRWGDVFRPSRPTLGPIQPPLQWVLILSRG